MKLEIPGQLRGSDAGKVMPLAIKLRRELEASFAALGDKQLTLISPILRVGGELGTFGADGVENVRITGKEATCDVVIEVRHWNGLSEDQIASMIRSRVMAALATLMAEAGFDPVPDFLCEKSNQKDGTHG